MPDDQRWCQAWALDNLKPHVYAEFAKLDPAKMDDLDRTVWRSPTTRSVTTQTNHNLATLLDVLG